MPDDFLGYFERELSYLRDMGSSFARKYPKVAGRLLLEPGKCEDPHIERLIESFAFLCARIQRKIDDGLPEITQSLLQAIYPQLTSPIPSLTVVRFAPLLGNVPEGGYEIPTGTTLFSKPVDGMPCQFSTAYPATLWPLEVVGATIEPPGKLVQGARQVVRLSLRLHGGSGFSGFKGDSLRFYLNGQSQHVFQLYQLLMNHLCSVECTPPDAPSSAALQLPAVCLQPVGFAPDHALFPYPERSFPGYRLLLEYFSFPAKFLFLDLVGLSALKSTRFGNDLDLLFYLDTSAPESLVVGPQTFCLYATPAINAFQKVAEPIRLDHRKCDYRVIPDLRREGALEVLTVDEVSATEADCPGEVKEYRQVFAGGCQADGISRLWQMQRRPSSREHDCGTDVVLSFCDGAVSAAAPKEEAVFVRVTCSNGDLPAKLPFGDPAGDFDTESAAPLAAILCLFKPTASLRPVLDGAQQRRLISHLSLNYLSLVEGGAAAFKQLLSLYDFAATPTTAHQISGIVSVKSCPVTRRIGAGFCRGMEVTLVFDETKYVGNSLYLFASVLERFLAQYVSVNSFVQLVAESASNGTVIKRWPPRSGERVLL